MAADRVPSLRPLGVGDVLDELFAVYRRGFKTFVGITALVQVPLAVLALPIYAASSRFGQRMVDTEDLMAALEALGGATAALGALLALLSLVGTILMIAAASYATSAIYLGQQPSIGEAYRFALDRFWGLIGLGLVYFAIFVGLFLASVITAIVPPLLCISLPLVAAAGAYLAVAWSLATPALVLEERIGPLHALRRSQGLVRGAWLRTFATLFVLVFLITVIQFLASGLVEAGVAGVQLVVAPGQTVRPEWLAVVSGLLQSLAGVLYGPLTYIGLTLVYYDRRVRVEAFDLALLARQLAPPPPPDVPRHDA
jgi:hypothetical protein